MAKTTKPAKKTTSSSEPTPFTFVAEINGKKNTAIFTPETAAQYVPFVINRSLSYFVDTVLAANEMNIHHDLPKDLQFKYLCGAVSSRSRFGKWATPTVDKNAPIVARHFGCGMGEAADIIATISRDELHEILLVNA